MSKGKIIIWVDASYNQYGASTWGACYICPNTGKEQLIRGVTVSAKNSTHAEMAGVFEASMTLNGLFPEGQVEVRMDCKSLVDCYMEPEKHKAKNLHICRIISKLKREFKERLTLKHVKGHCHPKDRSLDATNNRKVHYLALGLLREQIPA